MYIKKIVVGIALIGLVAAGVFSYFIYQAVFAPNTTFTTATHTIYIPSGAVYHDVAKQMKPLVKDFYSFSKLAEKKGYTKNVKAGRYVIRKDANSNELINALRTNNVPVQLTFNNQERLVNLAGRIAQQIEADSTALVRVFEDTVFLKENGFDEATALAMYIPNKYEFFWNTSAKGFRERMLKEYKRFWNESRLKKAEELGLTPNEVTVIASIVQKETAKVDERPRVAGVYMNRYNNQWKLEADPTVIYALKHHTGEWDRVIKRVLYKDLELENPYNTYQNIELPPGPIAMPDISSIDAVLNYEKHEYYFFVANVQKFGYHKFAKTLAQHNRNKIEYVKWLQKKGIKR